MGYFYPGMSDMLFIQPKFQAANIAFGGAAPHDTLD